jgi:hypothetical protein
MSTGDDLKDGTKIRPHKLKGATHQLCAEVWNSVDRNRKSIYENLGLKEPKSFPIPTSGPEQGLLLQLLYEKHVAEEITSWAPEIWRAAANQVNPKLLEHLLLVATSYEYANPRAAWALLEAYRDTPQFKERFLYHVNQFICAIALSPLPKKRE